MMVDSNFVFVSLFCFLGKRHGELEAGEKREDDRRQDLHFKVVHNVTYWLDTNERFFFK